MLPKLDTPTYKLTLPSTKEVVEYRPFLVKEEKILLTVMEETKDETGNFTESVRDTTIRVISNCTFGKVDGNKLPDFDIDYLFLNIRAKSRGETLSPVFTCQNNVDGEKCGEANEVQINLNDVSVDFPDKDYSKVMINDKVGIQFKYLTAEEKKIHEKEQNNVERMFKLIVDSIDFIFDEDKIYKGSETTKAELLQFIEELTEDTFDKIKDFFENQPVLRHKAEYKCKKCGYKEDITIEGLDNFFG